MKKTRKIKIFTFIALLSMAAGLYAQGFSYGIVLGSGASSMYMKNIPVDINHSKLYAPSVGFNFNGFVSYKSNGNWGVSLEPGFIKKRSIQQFDYLNSNYSDIHYKVINDFNSVELPLLFDYYFSKKFYATVGLEIEYRLSEKATITDKATYAIQEDLDRHSVYVTKNTGNHILSDNILPDDDKRLNTSGLIGLQYKVNSRVDVGIRAGIGLTELIQVEWLDRLGYNYGESIVFNNYLQFLIKVSL